MDARRFEVFAGEVLARRYGQPLGKGRLPSVPKEFDYVSADGSVVGDAKFYTLVGGSRLPPAKFSVIAEHVWLLERTDARHKFLVFGNDVRVPAMWLKRYRPLVEDVAFYFVDSDGALEVLA